MVAIDVHRLIFVWMTPWCKPFCMGNSGLLCVSQKCGIISGEISVGKDRAYFSNGINVGTLHARANLESCVAAGARTLRGPCRSKQRGATIPWGQRRLHPTPVWKPNGVSAQCRAHRTLKIFGGTCWFGDCLGCFRPPTQAEVSSAQAILDVKRQTLMTSGSFGGKYNHLSFYPRNDFILWKLQGK